MWLLAGDDDDLAYRLGLAEHLEHELGDVGARDGQAAAEVCSSAVLRWDCRARRAVAALPIHRSGPTTRAESTPRAKR